jgi:mono/diheme cytochrome c family protein
MGRLALGAIVLGLAALACSEPEADLPRSYRDLTVPKARIASAEGREHGQALFAEHCVLCHGVTGDGRGQRREGFTRPPRDFTDVAWRRTVTPRRVFFAVKEGVHGTAMPSWKTLPDDDIWDLTAYVLSIAKVNR